MKKPTISIANKAQLIVPSGFNNYDLCLNSYVGCQFGCTYCYVRFFLRDEDHPWGEWVRIRTHLTDKLPKELDKGHLIVRKKGKITKTIVFKNARIVLGTMTDPYQPQERKLRLTRTALEIMANHSCQFKKVGIFTRSPLIIEDLDLIKRLPNPRIHYTITPYPEDVKHKIEPITPRIVRQIETVEAIVKSGIRLHLNLSPIIPTLSECQIDFLADNAARIAPSEYFIDPVGKVTTVVDTITNALGSDSRAKEIREIFTHPDTLYLTWKASFRAAWEQAWFKAVKKYKNTTTLGIWADHDNDVWVDLRTGLQMNQECYGDDLEKSIC